MKNMGSNSLSPVSVDRSVRNSLPNEKLGEMRLEKPFCLFFNHCIGTMTTYYIYGILILLRCFLYPH